MGSEGQTWVAWVQTWPQLGIRGNQTPRVGKIRKIRPHKSEKVCWKKHAQLDLKHAQSDLKCAQLDLKRAQLGSNVLNVQQGP